MHHLALTSAVSPLLLIIHHWLPTTYLGLTQFSFFFFHLHQFCVSFIFFHFFAGPNHNRRLYFHGRFIKNSINVLMNFASIFMDIFRTFLVPLNCTDISSIFLLHFFNSFFQTKCAVLVKMFGLLDSQDFIMWENAFSC